MEHSFEVFDFEIPIAIHVTLHILVGVEHLPARLGGLLQLGDNCLV